MSQLTFKSANSWHEWRVHWKRQLATIVKAIRTAKDQLHHPGNYTGDMQFIARRHRALAYLKQQARTHQMALEGAKSLWKANQELIKKLKEAA